MNASAGPGLLHVRVEWSSSPINEKCTGWRIVDWDSDKRRVVFKCTSIPFLARHNLVALTGSATSQKDLEKVSIVLLNSDAGSRKHTTKLEKSVSKQASDDGHHERRFIPTTNNRRSTVCRKHCTKVS
jgi:hypothetical protein